MNNMGGDSGNLILLKRIKELEAKNTELEAQVESLNSKIVIGMGTIDMSATGTVNQSIPFGQTFDIIPKAVFAMFQVCIGENAITSIGNITESEFIARAKCVQVGSNADKICWIAVW